MDMYSALFAKATSGGGGGGGDAVAVIGVTLTSGTAKFDDESMDSIALKNLIDNGKVVFIKYTNGNNVYFLHYIGRYISFSSSHFYLTFNAVIYDYRNVINCMTIGIRDDISIKTFEYTSNRLALYSDI